VEKSEARLQDMQELRFTAREGLTQMYDWEHVTDQYVEVFETLAKKKQLSPKRYKEKKEVEKQLSPKRYKEKKEVETAS